MEVLDHGATGERLAVRDIGLAEPRTNGPIWASVVATPDILWLCILVLLSGLLFGPVVLHGGTWLYGFGGDGTGTPAGIAQRLTGVREHGLFGTLPSLMGAPFAYPSLPTQADPLWLYAGVALASVWTTVGATNAMIFLGVAGTAVATYLLLRRQGLPTGAAGLGALAYGFCPIRLAEAQEHFLLLDNFWFVIEGALLLNVARRGATGAALSVGVCLGLTELDNPYLAYFGGLLAAVWFAGLAAVPLSRQQWSVASHTVKQGLLTLLMLIVVVVPAQLPLLLLPTSAGPAGDGVSLVHDIGDLDRLSLRWWNFLLPYANNPVVGPLGRSTFYAHLGVDTVTEQSTSTGYVALALAITATVVLVRRRRRPFRREEAVPRHLVGLAFACIGTGIAFGLPPMFVIGSIHLQMPPYFMHALVPEVRTTSRIDLLIQFGMAILAALGAAHLLSVVRSARRRNLVGAALGVAMLIEYTNVPPWRYVSLLPAPAFYRWLAQTPVAQTGIVVQYPIEASDLARTPLYAFYAYAVHHHPIFNGVVKDTPPDALRKNVEDILNPTMPSAWAALGVRTIALDRTFIGPHFGNAGLRWQPDYERRLPTGLAPAYQDEQWEAVHVTGAPAAVVAGFGAGFGNDTLGTDGREWRWIGNEATIWLDDVTDQPVLTAVWTQAHNNGGGHTLRLGDAVAQPVSAGQAETAVALVTVTPPGLHAFTVAADGPAAPLAGSENQTPVSMQVRSLEPAPVTTHLDRFQDDGQTSWVLTGVSLGACTLEAGALLDAALLWRVDAPTTRDETIFLHLVNASGGLAAQDDGPPNHGTVATSRLGAGGRITDVHTIQTAKDLVPGRYRLFAGLYDRQTGARLKLAGGTDTVELGTVTITPAGDGPQRTPCSW